MLVVRDVVGVRRIAARMRDMRGFFRPVGRCIARRVNLMARVGVGHDDFTNWEGTHGALRPPVFRPSQDSQRPAEHA